MATWPDPTQNLNAFTGVSATSVTEAMKIHYKPLRVKEMVYKNNPLLALMPKYESFGGLNMPIPILYGNPQRSGANFKQAQEIAAGSLLKQFVIDRKKAYSFASVDGQTIKASQGKTDAFLRYLTMEIDGAIHTIKRRLAIHMYGDGFGTLGVQSGAIATKTITLADVNDITNFEVGMWLTIYDGPGAVIRTRVASAPLPANTFQVDAVDRTNGTVTLDVAPGGSGTNDVLYAYGDISQDPDTAGYTGDCVAGLASWIPSNRTLTTGNPLFDDFFGVNRSTDPTRLGGIYYDGSSMPVEEALISAAARVARAGGSPSYCFVDYDVWTSLEKALGAKVMYTQAKARDVDIGFQAIQIQGPNGPLRVIPDQNCQPNTAWMLQLDTWSLNSLGSAPQLLDQDGNRMLRETTEDAYEVRVGYYANMACNAPGWNVRVAL